MFIAGKWAPISLILVALVLVLYQTAYSEVGTALPLNGGTYNILLNTTNKLTAAIAASLTILSYTATAVVSANTAMTYAHFLSEKIPILWATIGTKPAAAQTPTNTHFPLSSFDLSLLSNNMVQKHATLTLPCFVSCTIRPWLVGNASGVTFSVCFPSVASFSCDSLLNARLWSSFALFRAHGCTICDEIGIVAMVLVWRCGCAGVLFIFACLTTLGIGESAAVAFVLFVMHLITLTVISAVGITTLAVDGPAILKQNWALPPVRSVPADIFFGFCAGLLGVSGFESSSNYIEEQADGVFPKTLRNMTIIVAIFNPLLAFLATSLMPVSFATDPNSQLLILGQIARVSVGYWLEVVVSVDAILVLSGAVLTSYVGVNGLVRRMTLDRCLPQFLLSENKWRGTNHWIILIFFLLTSSLILIVNGNPITLSGVYTVAFLSVLALFAIGNLLLKFKRSRLPRLYNAPVPIVILGLSLVVSALIGNIVLNVVYLEYFSIYFSITLLIVITMLTRTRILKWLHRSPLKKILGRQLVNAVKTINQQEMIFFTKTDELSVLNKAILYVRDNELTDRLRVVHVYKSEDQIPPRLRENIKILDEMYPKHRIDLGLVKGTFNPALVEKLADVFQVPKNFMYITTPSNRFPHSISEFGGVRLITH